MSLENNTILATGSTGGFGLEFASKLIALSDTGIVTGRNPVKLNKVKEKLPSVFDVSNPGDIICFHGQVTTQFPELNVIISNAGEMRKISVSDKMLDAAIDGMRRDKDEIFPGFAKVARILSRVSPGFALAQAGKMGSSTIYVN